VLHGKNLQPLTGAVFVNSLQVIDSLQENPLTYGESVSASFNLRYPGQYYDRESGLSYNYFRSYDAKTGRYTQNDPIDLAGGWNKFSYVNENPLSYIDPLGLEKIILFGPGDSVLRSAATSDRDVPGRLTIYAHGNPSAIADSRSGRDISMTPAQAAALIRASGSWNPGMPVTVEACEVGKGDNNFIQGLSKNLGVPVTGPNSLLVPRPVVSGGVVLVPYTWYFLGFTGSPGQYITVNPKP
jgi:RHS repeat-associated protein